MNAPTAPEVRPVVSLVRKLASVMGAVERVPKTGRNKFHNYDYATESDITSAVRSAMAEQGVMMIPTVEAIEWSEVTTGAGKKERMCTVNWLFTLLDADSDAKIEFRNIGQGQDSGDKAFYKAATGAVKYALLKLFLIPTGDDPEESSPDSEPSAEEIAAGKKKMEERAAREAAWAKDVAKFSALGKSLADLSKKLGKPLDGPPGNDDWKTLLDWGKELKAAAAKSVSPDEAARLEVMRKAEADLAALDAKKPSITYENCVQSIRDARSAAECVLIESEFAGIRPSPTKAQVRDLNRISIDRQRVLTDAARVQPPAPSDNSDVPF